MTAVVALRYIGALSVFTHLPVRIQIPDKYRLRMFHLPGLITCCWSADVTC